MAIWPPVALWPHMAVWPSGHIYGHIWPYVAIYGHIWPCGHMAIYGHMYQFMVTYGHMCPSCHVWSYGQMATYGNIWPHMATSGHMTIYGHMANRKLRASCAPRRPQRAPGPSEQIRNTPGTPPEHPSPPITVRLGLDGEVRRGNPRGIGDDTTHAVAPSRGGGNGGFPMNS